MRTLEERFAMSSTDERVAEAADLLHGYALLAEGSPLPDPARFSRLFSELLTRGV